MKNTVRKIIIITCAWHSLLSLGQSQRLAQYSKKWPKNLSSWKIFHIDSKNNITLYQGAIHYQLVNPLFSDYASKFRTIQLPPHSAMTFRHSSKTLEFPIGSIISKTFAYPKKNIQLPNSKVDIHSPQNSLHFSQKLNSLTGSHLIETRLLIKTKEKTWIGLPYQWHDNQKDATLKLIGGRHQIVLTVNSQPESFIYSIPNMNQCQSCHTKIVDFEKHLTPIGPKPKHLNRMIFSEQGPMNQLLSWQNQGIIKDMPDIRTITRLPNWQTQNQPINDRARAYLDINCAHCHHQQGPARSSGLYLSYEITNPTQIGICKSPVAAGNGSLGLPYAIFPGNPNQSLLLKRLLSTDPQTMMPEIGRNLAHQQAGTLVHSWISQMTETCP